MATFVSFSQSLKNILMQLERRLKQRRFHDLKKIGPQCVLLSKKKKKEKIGPQCVLLSKKKGKYDKSMKMVNVELGNEFSHALVMLNTSYFTK